MPKKKVKRTPLLSSLDLDGVAAFLKSDECKNVVVLSGAGMSCAAGIPDFRSPGGMYDTLRPELLTATAAQQRAMRSDPTSVVYKDMFLQNQFPYHEVRRPFILGTAAREWKATLGHRFVELLHRHGKLRRVYTQNIDGLDYQLDSIPPELIVPVHGSIGRVECESCGVEADYGRYIKEVRSCIKDIYGLDPTAPKESTHILCTACKQPTVKPATVLFGGSLPDRFFQLKGLDFQQADLLLVVGTSLVVQPAAAAVAEVREEGCVRLICNREEVGQDLGVKYGSKSTRDVHATGDSDDTFAALAAKMGWLEELADMRELLPEQSQKSLDAVLELTNPALAGVN